MALSHIQHVVVVVMVVPTLLCPWPTLATKQPQRKPSKPIKPIKPLFGPIGDLVNLRSLDEIPVLSKAPEGLHVLVVTRHGMYYPVSPSTLDGDKQKGFEKDPPLQLTKKGGDLMNLVGKLLVRRYADHFNNMFLENQHLKETRVMVTATDTNIAKDSANKIIKGMKEEDPEIKGLKIQLSKDDIESNSYFYPQLLNKQDKQMCKVFILQARHLVDPKTIKMTASLFEGKIVDDVFQQYDRLQMERLEELELPDWTKAEKGRETLRQMKGAAITRMENLIGDEMELWKYFVSYLLNNIFDEFLIHDHADPTLARISRFHLHVVDDYIMTALVWWLRLEGEIDAAFGDPDADYYPQAGDSLVLEINDQKMVTVSYMRLVGESSSQVGFKRLSLSKRIESFVIPVDSYDGMKTYKLCESDPNNESVPVYMLYNTIINKNQWSDYCQKVKNIK